MRAVIQRVNWAKALTGDETLGEIETGLLVFLGAGKDDDERDVAYLAEKTAGLRVFEDNEGKMNLSLKEIGGAALVVSQFTLFGDCRKGRRPSFTGALEPVKANEYYLQFVDLLKNHGVKVATGRFQADMEVRSSNNGPVTLLIDSKKIF